MATVIGTYTYDWGRAIPDFSTQDKAAASTLWTLVHQLLGNLGGLTSGIWSCEGSSDGSTGGMDAVNRWWNGGVFDVTKMPYNYGSGSASGWMVLKSPSALGPLYILFVRGLTGHYNDNNWVVTFIARTPFTGSGTALPASTTGKDCSFYSTSYSNYLSWRIGPQGSLGARNCHLTLASDGAFFWSNSIPGGRMCGGMLVNPLADTFAGNPYNVVVGLLGDVSAEVGTLPVCGSSGGAQGATVTSAYCVASLSRDMSNSVNYSGRFFGWGANGLGCSYTVIIPMVAGFQSRQDALGTYFGCFGTGQPWFDFERQEYAEFPIYLCTNDGTNTQQTIKGKLRDMYWASTGAGNVPQGTLEPSGADPITRVIWGDVWVPASGTWTP